MLLVCLVTLRMVIITIAAFLGSLHLKSFRRYLDDFDGYVDERYKRMQFFFVLFFADIQCDGSSCYLCM